VADKPVLDLVGGKDPPLHRDYVLGQEFSRDLVYLKGVAMRGCGRRNLIGSR
jgi:hypothetical protein